MGGADALEDGSAHVGGGWGGGASHDIDDGLDDAALVVAVVARGEVLADNAGDAGTQFAVEVFLQRGSDAFALIHHTSSALSLGSWTLSCPLGSFRVLIRSLGDTRYP